MEFPDYSMNKSPQFRRPLVSEWMAPPKSSNLPLWSPPLAKTEQDNFNKRNLNVNRETEASNNEPSGKSSKTNASSEIRFCSLGDTPLTSRRVSSTKHRARRRESTLSKYSKMESTSDHCESRLSKSNVTLNLKLSPRTTLSIYSPQHMEHEDLPQEIKKNEHISMEIHSRKRRSRRDLVTNDRSFRDNSISRKVMAMSCSSRSEDSSSRFTEAPLRPEVNRIESKSGIEDWLEYRGNQDLSSSTSRDASTISSLPRGGVAMAQPVRKIAVLSDFVPPQGSAREQKDVIISPNRKGPCVKKVEIPEFKPPYSFSPPQKLSPPKTALKTNKNVRNDSQFVKKINDVAGAGSSKLLQKADSLVVTKVAELVRDSSALASGRNVGGEVKEILLNNGKPDVTLTPRKKATQEYIKEQKKRRHQLTEKEKAKIKIELEEKKKKLEELRIKSLQLAAASKKRKKSDQKASKKLVENEEDASTSLGLRDGKPRRSFQHSLAILGNSSQNYSEIKNTNAKEYVPGPVAKALEMKKYCEEETSPEFNKPTNGTVGNVIPSVTWDCLPQHGGLLSEQPAADDLTVPEVAPVSIDTTFSSKDLNLRLQKLAESLECKIKSEARKKVTTDQEQHVSRRRQFDSTQNDEIRHFSPLRKEKRKKTSKNYDSVVVADHATIASLKNEITEISKNFKLLQEKLVSDPAKKPMLLKRDIDKCRIPDWLQNIRPRPHPYNVFTAVKNKLRITVPGHSEYPSALYSQLQQPETPRSVTSQQVSSNVTRMNSGSDLSSSILDSKKVESIGERVPSQLTNASIRESVTSMPASDEIVSSYRENIVLMPPDIRVISNNLAGEVLNNSIAHDVGPGVGKTINTDVLSSARSTSTIAEIIDNLSEISEKSTKEVKRTNERPAPSDLQARLQAELSVLDSMQFTLSQIVEAARLKTHLGLNKNINEKAVNTEPIKLSSIGPEHENGRDVEEPTENEINSERSEIEEDIQTEVEDSGDSTLVEDIENSENSQPIPEISQKVQIKISKSETVPEVALSPNESFFPLKSNNLIEEGPIASIETSGKQSQETEFIESTAGISLQMLHGVIKDEELRSEHQLALIQLRLNSLIDKTKAELRLLEGKKRTLKKRGGGDGGNEQKISAIKKKQRGILLRYQTEKKEIEGLKKMHEIASEERIIMMKQQEQIQKMQCSTKAMLVKLKRGSLPKKNLKKQLGGGGPELSENMESSSDTMFSSMHTTTVSDFEISSQRTVSNGEEEIQRRNQTILQNKLANDAEKLNRCKRLLGEREEKLIKEKHFVEEILQWENRLALEEKTVKEMRKRAMNLGRIGLKTKNSHVKLVEDRSTSPFQNQEDKYVVEKNYEKEGDKLLEETSKSSILEVFSGASVTEDIPEEISKTRSKYSDDFEPASDEKSIPIADKAVVDVKMTTCLNPPPVLIKTALSPRLSCPRRNSSGSDDSANLSYTETPSEQSDVEGRITALHEQLRNRKLEADRLRREQKKKNRERLKAKEESLLKQIQAYDSYIEKLKQDIEQEREASPHPIVKPLIKQPKAERKLTKSLKKASDDQIDSAIANTGMVNEANDESIIEHFSISQSVSETPSPNRDIEECSFASEQLVINSMKSRQDHGNDSDSMDHITTAESFDVVNASLKTENKESIVDGDIEEGSFAAEEFPSETKTSMHDSRSISVSLKEITTAESLEGVQSGIKSAKDASTAENVITEEEEEQCDVTSGSESLSYESVKTTLHSSGKNEKTSSAVAEISIVKASFGQTESINQENKGSEENTEERTHISSESYIPERLSDEDNKESISSIIPTNYSGQGSSQEISGVNKTVNASIEQALSLDDDVDLDVEVALNKSEDSIKPITNTESPEEILEISQEEESGGENSSSLRSESRKDYLSDSFESGTEPEVETEKSELIKDLVYVELDVSEKVVSEDTGNEEKVEEITDSILNRLLGETFNLADSLEAKVKAHKIDNIIQELTANLVGDSIEKILGIYDWKTKNVFRNYSDNVEIDEEPISPENITPEIRRRIHQIMSSTQSSSQYRSRPRHFFQTAYDISPDSTSPTNDQSSDAAATRGNIIAALLASPNRKEGAIRTSQDLESQPWFDEIYGFGKAKKEAEKLRLQQLQIDQEIEQLQQAQSQVQQVVPYYYMREIPNKPPPPYTPPVALEEPVPVPTSPEQITRNVTEFSRTILSAVRRGQDPCCVEPRNLGPKDHFRRFLWDLAKELVIDVTCFTRDVPVEPLPWEKVPQPFSACRSALRPSKDEDVLTAVLHRTEVALGMKPPVEQESLIVRWSRKKRDHVDELLIWESQAEEAEWTRYDQDFVTIKNEVTVSLIQSLLQDTADVMDAVLKKRRNVLK